MTAVEVQATTSVQDLVARFVETVPADLRIRKYKTSGDNIDAQLAPGFHATSSRRLRTIAGLFGLAYAELDASGGRLELVASGRIGGVFVKFWDNVPVPCSCARKAVSS